MARFFHSGVGDSLLEAAEIEITSTWRVNNGRIEGSLPPNMSELHSFEAMATDSGPSHAISE